ncbi:hypothetical protein GQ54DRAFT_306093 [Martensiomyces pterosporus]|nr:hypothetical protein GQ54DRAFT_306093 [Martensiomyces pterosporus]
MVYDFQDFISRTQCHDSLVSLYVRNDHVYFDFDVELFKTLESVEFGACFSDKNDESTGSVDLYKSAFTSLLRAKTDIQRMTFKSGAPDTLFQVPRDIGCVNLRSLSLGVEVDFKSMLRLLSKLKNLVELRLNINCVSTYRSSGGEVDIADPRGRHCYTASYALELALHLPVLERMTLSVDHEGHVGLFEALLDRPQQQPPPHAWAVVLLQSTLCWGNQDKHKSQSMESLQKLTTDNYGCISLADNAAHAILELKYRGDIAQHTCGFERNFTMMGTPRNDVLVTNVYVNALPAHICRQLARKGLCRKLSDTIRDATIEERFDWTQPTVSGSEEM